IAMLNSPQIVKENADIVTNFSNNEDGIYYVINDLLNKEGEENE
ncbi:MAG: Cof-type HAD-IIB family hydrolase, partial [Bacilli bacterium]|nr:Cof-type HAD-IIB family hydrolase [Bacilli bacterium]